MMSVQEAIDLVEKRIHEAVSKADNFNDVFDAITSTIEELGKGGVLGENEGKGND